jgi:hypothetical protein
MATGDRSPDLAATVIRGSSGAQHGSPDDQPTYHLNAPRGTLYYGARRPLRRRLTDPVAELELLSSRTRIMGAWLALMATAEMNVLARHTDGRPWWAVGLAWFVQAPLHAGFAAGFLALLGRLTHRTARRLGGSGDREATTEIVVLFAALMALPAGMVLLLSGGNGDVVTAVQLVLSVVALVLGIKLIARIEALDTTRAAAALLLPGLVVVALITVLAIVLSIALPGGWYW